MAQTQTPALTYADDDQIDYTPAAATYSGDVVVIGNTPLISPCDIAASVKGALATEGVWKVPKITGAISVGDPIYWNSTADPVTGTAGTGAAQVSPTGGKFMGFAALAAASGDTYVQVLLLPGKSIPAIPAAKFTTDATGTQTAAAGALTGANNVFWTNTANGAVALTTRTATQMFADTPNAYVGMTFTLRINSAGNNTVTLTAGTGVTITGTATAATTKFRDFVATFTSATALTFQDVGGN